LFVGTVIARCRLDAIRFWFHVVVNQYAQVKNFSAEPFTSDYAATLNDVGIAKSTAHRWQNSAEIPYTTPAAISTVNSTNKLRAPAAATSKTRLNRFSAANVLRDLADSLVS
jgi:hypothetical protein